jgi:hypothetical protein
MARRFGSQTDYTPEVYIVETIDDLQRRAEEGRNRVLGYNFFQRSEQFYNFDPGSYERISYQPLVRVADLQMILLREAGELATPIPKFFIHKNGDRDKDREKAFRGNWQHFNYQLQILFAEVHAGMTGTCPVQVIFDPDRDHGRGGVVLKARNPATYFPDPDALEDRDREYVILDDYMSESEIGARYGQRALSMVSLAREMGGTYKIPKPAIDFPVSGEGMPPGPLQTMGPLGYGAFSSSKKQTTRIRVRTLFIKDSTRLPFTDELGFRMASEYNLVPKPETLPAFPTGRLIVEAQRRVLYDGPNPYPGIPVFRICQFPPLYGHWAPPPVRYTQDLQFLAEDLFSQTYENAYRMNNAEKYISRLSGLGPDDVNNLPGRVYFTDPAGGDKPVQTVVTPAFPAHFIEYPKFLLQLQKDLQGQSGARQGQAGGGNTGVGLFDAEVYQQQALTRVKAHMLTDSYMRIGEFVFETMALNMGTRRFPFPEGSELTQALWRYEPGLALADWELELDARSIKIDSATQMRNLALALARIGKIDDETLYDWLDVPDADNLIAKMRTQQVFNALQAMQQQAQGGGKAKGGHH